MQRDFLQIWPSLALTDVVGQVKKGENGEEMPQC